MKNINIEVVTRTEVRLGEIPMSEVMATASNLAHCLLEELSKYRQRNGLTDAFDCEGQACEFLDMIGD